MMMKSTLYPILAGLSLMLLISCGSKDERFEQPSQEAAVIEETDGGCDVLAQEFGVECDLNEGSYKRSAWTPINTTAARASHSKNEQVLTDHPLTESSADKEFPLRGSWRQSRTEVMDLVNRWMWSPEQQKPVRLLNYFDMALIINVAARTDQTPSHRSAQQMQVFVRQDDSDIFTDWKRIHIWPVSSGLPGGAKIATYTGVFKLDPKRLFEDYSSESFKGANMYESMFLYHEYQNGDLSGVAIHGTYNYGKLGRRDSGGCIRLAREKAQCLFNTITGRLSHSCLEGGLTKYWGTVPSFIPRYGEADPEYLRSGLLEVGGYRVLVAIYNDDKDEL